MDTYAYRLDHDLGFAPNPYFGWCSLACCMPKLRKQASEGDLVVGIAGSGRQGLGRIHPQLIYWMRVSETPTFDQYWNDERFVRKKPDIDGPKYRQCGDNTYRLNTDTGEWDFDVSMHYIPSAEQRYGGHVVKDTSVNRILLAQDFTYWGGQGPSLPNHLLPIFPKTRGYKVNHSDPELVKEFHLFIGLDSPSGVMGDPADWTNKKYYKE